MLMVVDELLNAGKVVLFSQVELALRCAADVVVSAGAHRVPGS